jgi:hypothetical protein
MKEGLRFVDSDMHVMEPPDLFDRYLDPMFKHRVSVQVGADGRPSRGPAGLTLLAGGVEFGQANRFIHIWAYKSMDQRLAIREQARKAGIWPPKGGGDELLAQTSKIVMPSAFSPLQ